MIFGSFLLAALLNRSAMEEVPASPATPVGAVAPMSPAVSEAAQVPVGCVEAEARIDSQPSGAQVEQAALDRCGKPD